MFTHPTQKSSHWRSPDPHLGFPLDVNKVKMEGFGRHQALYKGATPPWKDTYRRRCKERLKKSREKFFNRVRHFSDEASASPKPRKTSSLVKELMAVEWQAMQSEQSGLPSLDIEMDTDEECLDVDDTMRIFEEIRQELLKEEQQILAEYESAQTFDEAVAASALQEEEPDFVTCPVCQRSQLFMHKAVLLCHCGLRIDTEQDCVTLPDVKKSLRQGVDLHSESCHSVPSFAVVDQVGVKNLLMSCQTCDFMYIVV